MSHTVLENQMKSIISTLESGTTFMLRDILDNPPALLGRRLYEGVESGEIPNVEFIGKEDGIDKYVKK